MKVPRYVYVIIDKRTGLAFKSSMREIPFYKSLGGVKIAMRHLAVDVDLKHFQVIKYEVVEKEVVLE
jgi:hypothetical protein